MLSSLSELFPKTNTIENATHLFTDNELDDIAQKVQFAYDQDLTTCKEKIADLKKLMGLAMIVTQTKSYPWNNASNIIYPLIANAAINFGANCYPGIIQDNEVVKAKIIGNDDGIISKFQGEKKMDEKTGQVIRQGAGDKLKRGNRVATMMNWQLMEQMTWWEGDVDKEVHSLPILGTLYKKIYYDSLKKMNVSELIYPDKIIINNNARDIDCATVTQIIELYPQEILQRIRSGFYCDFDLDLEDLESQPTSGSEISSAPSIKPKNENRTNNNLHIFLEQHTWLDLDDDGFLEPYIVTIHQESSKTVRIIPRFENKDIIRNDKGEVQEIKACIYFVVRRFLPSFDGGFLGMGFGHLLGNLNDGINTTLNQMIDAGHLSITGGGLISNNVKLKGGKLSISLNEYKLVNVAGGDLASSVYPFPKTEPSQVLFNLLESLIVIGKETGSMRDVLNGDVAANIAPTTMMSLVEQGMKQFKSIYKRFYKSLKTEFKLLYDLNSKYLTQEQYLEVLDDEDSQTVSVKIDFDQKSYNIVPVADVEAINSAQKMAQASFLGTFINNPYVDQMRLLNQIFDITKIPNVDELVIQPPQQQDPAIQIAQMQMQVEQQKLQLAAAKNDIELQKIQTTLPKMAAEIEKLKSSSMVDFANVGKIAAESDLKGQEQQVKLVSHVVDAEIAKIEVEARLHEAKLRHENELLKLSHEHVQNSTDRMHEHHQNELDREHEKGMIKATVKPEASAS